MKGRDLALVRGMAQQRHEATLFFPDARGRVPLREKGLGVRGRVGGRRLAVETLAPAAVVFMCVFICSPEIGELPIGLRGTIIIIFFIIRVPLPYFSPRITYPIPPSGYFPYVRGRA